MRVMDTPFAGISPASAYTASGIEAEVKAAGGEMEIMSPIKYTECDISNGVDLHSWKVYRDAMETDVLINVPIAKQHSLARITLGAKNLLGLVDSPNLMHSNLGQRVADLACLIRPNLTVIDAVRILVDHGPTGGSLNDVKQTNTIIASHDIVAVDAYAAQLFFKTSPQKVGYIKLGGDMGLGKIDLTGLKVRELSV